MTIFEAFFHMVVYILCTLDYMKLRRGTDVISTSEDDSGWMEAHGFENVMQSTPNKTQSTPNETQSTPPSHILSVEKTLHAWCVMRASADSRAIDLSNEVAFKWEILPDTCRSQYKLHRTNLITAETYGLMFNNTRETPSWIHVDCGCWV